MNRKEVLVVALFVFISAIVIVGITIDGHNKDIARWQKYCDYGYTVILGSIDCKNHSEFRAMIDNSMYRDYDMKGYDTNVILIEDIGWSFYSEVWSLSFETPDSCNAKEIWKNASDIKTLNGFCKPTIVSGYSLAPFNPITNISYIEGKVIESSWKVWNKDQQIVLESGKSFIFDETTDVKIGSVITVKKTQVLSECLISDVGINSIFGSSNLIGNGTNEAYLWNFIRNGNDTVYEMRKGMSYHFSYNDDYDRKEKNCELTYGDKTTFEVFEVNKQ